MKNFVWILVVYFLSFGPNLQANSTAPDVKTQEWLLKCRTDFKNMIIKEKIYNIAFSASPDIAKLPKSSEWSAINWKGKAIPIPDGKIKKIKVTEGQDGSLSMYYEDGRVLLFFKLKDKVPLAEQHALFGKKISMLEGMKLQYSTTLKNLDCNSPDIKKNRIVLNILNLKGISSPIPLQKVYQNTNGLDSVVEFHSNKKKINYRINVHHNDGHLAFEYLMPVAVYEKNAGNIWSFGTDFSKLYLKEPAPEVTTAFAKFIK